MRGNLLTAFFAAVLIGSLSNLTVGFTMPQIYLLSPPQPGGGQIYNLLDHNWEPGVFSAANDAIITLEQTAFYREAILEKERLEQERLKKEQERLDAEKLAAAKAAARVAPPPPAQAEGRKGSDTPPPPPPPAPPPPPTPEPEDDPVPPDPGEDPPPSGPGENPPPPERDLPPPPPAPERIMLGWHFVSMSSTAYVQYPSQQTGYNVYAPVAYFLTGSGESIRVARHNDFNRGVLVRARENGYQIWITVQQFGAALPAELFANPQRQSALINDLIQKALSDGAHGINIDFENMGLSNRDGFSRFMQELYPKARQHGLIISVDVTRPGTSSWAACYDHGALAQACDYLVLMAYDQYYAGSPVEGPVASLIWTESAITSVLSRGVPPGKLILGVPFYSRNWIIEQETITAGVDSVLVTVETANLRAQPSTASALLGQAQRNTLLPYQATVSGAAVDGDTNWYAVGYNQGTAYLSATLSRFLAAGETASAASRVAGSFALGLQHTLAMQNNYNPETRTSFYDTSAGRRDMFEVVMVDDAGLTLLTYRNQGGVLNKIWLENYDSLRQRYRLVEKYGLAGAAAWSLEWQNHVRSPWLEMMQ